MQDFNGDHSFIHLLQTKPCCRASTGFLQTTHWLVELVTILWTNRQGFSASCYLQFYNVSQWNPQFRHRSHGLYHIWHDVIFAKILFAFFDANPSIVCLYHCVTILSWTRSVRVQKSSCAQLFQRITLGCFSEKIIVYWRTFNKFPSSSTDIYMYLYARICNSNLAAYGRSIDIANSWKIVFNIYRKIVQ